MRAEVSWSYLIGAAIAIVVLVVVIMIFTGQMGSISKRFTTVAEPSNTAAAKTGWCLSTITQGKACGYQEGCSTIGERLGGRGTAVDPEVERCNAPGQIHAYSEQDNKFCCVTV